MAPNKNSNKSQAESLISQNKLTEAKKILQKICKRKGNDFASWLLLALVNRKLGQFNDAAKCCQHVLNRKPSHAQAWHLLGSCHQCTGDLKTAISSYEKAIKYDVELAESYYFMGNAYRESGGLRFAVENYKKAVNINSNYLEALSNLGATLRETGDINEAWVVLNKANKLKPDTPQVLCNLALLSMDIDKPDDALVFAKKANNVNSSFLDSSRILGSIYSQTGKIDSAINTYQKIIKIYPGDIDSIASLASIFEKRKDFDGSLKLIMPLIDSIAFNHEVLVTYSRLSENINVKHDTIKLLIEYIERNTLNNKEKVDIHYELGRRFDKEQNYDKAFHHYQQANAITRKLYPALMSGGLKNKLNSYLPKWKNSFNREDWGTLPVSSNNSKRPVFIVGMHRSGTSLTEQILSSHSSIYGAGEIKKMAEIAATLNMHPWNNEDNFIHKHSQLTTDKLNTLADEYLDTDEFIEHKHLRIVDNLHNNFLNVSLITRIFPEAAIIHVSRNPLDNCLSLYFQKFGLTLPYTTDLTESAIFYKQYESLMEYWNERLDANILNIKYEDLVNNLEETSKKMIKFCGLEWEDNCLNFHNTKRDVNTPSYHQVRKPIYTKSVDRWKHYEKHIQPLIDFFAR